jgi:hypothetical protein
MPATDASKTTAPASTTTPRRHGNDSPQVNRDVNRMDSDRQWCRDHHSDWDHSRFDVGIYFRP